jgi:hypothetical protein
LVRVAYLKVNERLTMVFDDTKATFDGKRFKKCDWSKLYPYAARPVPNDILEPRGKAVTVNCFVDADHAGCQVTHRSHTSVIVFVNRALLLWYSKWQNTAVESLTFRSEYIALKMAVDMVVEGLGYKLPPHFFKIIIPKPDDWPCCCC